MIRLNEREFADIVNYMRVTYGINLDKKKVLIECRMSQELERMGLTSFGKYFDRMKQDASGKMAGKLVGRLTTNYTYFMREPAHFKLLEEKIFPEMFQTNYAGFYQIWCAGCSSGEECYTLAMLLQEYKERGNPLPNIRITAADISEEVLKKAGEGVYSRKELEQLPADWQRKYFHKEGGDSFGINRELKYNIRFVKQNLMEQVNEKYDLILCRNVMIYFNRESKLKLVKQLEKSLNPGGYLLIGHAELLTGEETDLTSVYPAVYKKDSKNGKQMVKENIWKRKS